MEQNHNQSLIQQWRKEANMSQQTLAEKLGYESKVSVSLWETHKRTPDSFVIDEICRIFHKQPEPLYQEYGIIPNFNNFHTEDQQMLKKIKTILLAAQRNETKLKITEAQRAAHCVLTEVYAKEDADRLQQACAFAGVPCYVVDPNDSHQTTQYNPLARIRSESDCIAITDLLCETVGPIADDLFAENVGRSLIVSVMMTLCQYGRCDSIPACLSNVFAFLNGVAVNDCGREHGDWTRIRNTNVSEYNYFLDVSSHDNRIYAFYFPFYYLPDHSKFKIACSVLSVMNFMTLPNVERLTGNDTIDLEKPGLIVFVRKDKNGYEEFLFRCLERDASDPISEHDALVQLLGVDDPEGEIRRRMEEKRLEREADQRRMEEIAIAKDVDFEAELYAYDDIALVRNRKIL